VPGCAQAGQGAAQQVLCPAGPVPSRSCASHLVAGFEEEMVLAQMGFFMRRAAALRVLRCCRQH
jgi:hypothetical protein